MWVVAFAFHRPDDTRRLISDNFSESSASQLAWPQHLLKGLHSSLAACLQSPEGSVKDLAKVVPYAQLCLNGQGVDFL